MGRLPVLSGSEVCRILERNGFVAVRQRGSHRVMQKQLPTTTITVPVPCTIRLRAEHCLASSGNRDSHAPRLKANRLARDAVQYRELNSILRRLFGAIDHCDLDRPFRANHFQSELLKRGEDGGLRLGIHGLAGLAYR